MVCLSTLRNQMPNEKVIQLWSKGFMLHSCLAAELDNVVKVILVLEASMMQSCGIQEYTAEYSQYV